MLDDEQACAEGVAYGPEHRRERFGFTLRDPTRRLVEEQHGRFVREDAGEVHDPTRSGRQLVYELVGERAEPEHLDQLVDSSEHRCFGAPHGRYVERGEDGITHRDRVLPRDGDHLGDGECGEETTVLERSAETQPRRVRAPRAR